MSNDIIISVKNLTKIYKLYESPLDRLKESLHPSRRQYHQDFHALDNVSFDVKKGETIGIVGKNGSGKSTLLKIITGVLTQTTGNIKVNGKVSALLELGAGFNPELTGLENVYFNGAIMGYTHEEIEARLDNILSFADIGEFINQRVKTYSSGMFVRLAFAVSINVEPEILIVDEALSVGDMYFQAKCMSVINNLRENGTTMLIVSHSTNVIKSICNNAVYLKDGKLVSFGHAGEVIDNYEKDMRENINSLVADCSASTLNAIPKQIIKEDQNDFLINNLGFNHYGTGEVRIKNVLVVSKDGMKLDVADFAQEVTIKIFLQAISDTDIHIGYHIRDKNFISILSSSTTLETGKLLQVTKNERLVVEFTTKLPLTGGAYNLLVQVTRPIVLGEVAEFIDVVENAYLFRMNDRAPSKLWSSAYVQNKLNIRFIA